MSLGMLELQLIRFPMLPERLSFVLLSSSFVVPCKHTFSYFFSLYGYTEGWGNVRKSCNFLHNAAGSRNLEEVYNCVMFVYVQSLPATSLACIRCREKKISLMER